MNRPPGYDNQLYWSVTFDKPRITEHFIEVAGLRHQERTSLQGAETVVAWIDIVQNLEERSLNQQRWPRSHLQKLGLCCGIK